MEDQRLRQEQYAIACAHGVGGIVLQRDTEIDRLRARLAEVDAERDAAVREMEKALDWTVELQMDVAAMETVVEAARAYHEHMRGDGDGGACCTDLLGVPRPCPADSLAAALVALDTPPLQTPGKVT